MKEMPAALSIVSVDAYDQNKMDIDSTKSIYEQYVFPRYAPRLTVELQVRCVQGCEQSIVGAPGSRRIRACG